MKIKLQIINSFSLNGKGGNPAGVMLNADMLSDNQKQSIAAQAGLSETSFVSSSTVADFKLDFYTPTKQIPHCGHATIATFWYLRYLKKIEREQSSKETIDGTRKIFFKGDDPYMEQSSPKFTDIKDYKEIYTSIGYDLVDPAEGVLPVVGNTGNSFILVRVSKLSDLADLKPDFDLISKISAAHDSVGYYVYALAADGATIHSRMFAPSFGINEESATGMAAGPLACFLFPELNTTSFPINQGRYMHPPSESKLNVILNTNSQSIESVLVGGSAYIAKSVEIDV